MLSHPSGRLRLVEQIDFYILQFYCSCQAWDLLDTSISFF